MKKIKLKKWINNLLTMIEIILIIMLASDTDNFKLFVESKIILLILFSMNSYILLNYGREI